MLKNKKIQILIIIVILIIAVGIGIGVTKGFEYDLKYSESTTIVIKPQLEINLDEIYQISKQVINTENLYIETSGATEDIILITVPSITEEQKTEIVNKVNEKYNLELNSEEIEVMQNMKVKEFDIIYPYLLSIAVVVICVVAYLIIRYRKLGILKVSISSIAIILISQILFLCLMIITKIEINSNIMAYILALFILIIYVLTNSYEKMLEHEQKKK